MGAEMLTRSLPSAAGKGPPWSCLVEPQCVPASPARSGLRGTCAVKECSWQQAGSLQSDLTSRFPGQGQAAAHRVSAPAPRQVPSPNTTVLGGAVSEAREQPASHRLRDQPGLLFSQGTRVPT